MAAAATVERVIGEIAAVVIVAWLLLKRTYSFPPEFGQHLRQAYYLAVGDASLRRQELATVLNELHASGLQPVVFKGAALANTVYPDPACRPIAWRA